MSKTVTITPSLEEISKHIKDVVNDPEMRASVLRRASIKLALFMGDTGRGYPEEGPYNHMPGEGPWGWYQRKFGPRRLRKDGTVWGANTSQRLQTSWKTDMVDQYTASVYTGVTYAPYLMDPDKQVRWAYEHGWLTVVQIAEEYTPVFADIVLEEVDNQIDKI